MAPQNIGASMRERIRAIPDLVDAYTEWLVSKYKYSVPVADCWFSGKDSKDEVIGPFLMGAPQTVTD
jgi:hypothetical protein